MASRRAGRKSAKRKSTRKRSMKKRVTAKSTVKKKRRKRLDKPVDMPAGKPSPKHRHANHGDDVCFRNPTSKPLTIHFDSSPFIPSLGPQDITVPSKAKVCLPVDHAAQAGVSYPYSVHKTSHVMSSGPPNPPDVVVDN
jgi:hypothetical protein